MMLSLIIGSGIGFIVNVILASASDGQPSLGAADIFVVVYVDDLYE